MRRATHRITTGIFQCSIFTTLVLGTAGCVERKLSITSQPDGALVFLNDKEVGRTPIETDFVWYGTYDVQVRADGHKTLNQPTKLIAPWWQWPPFDLFAEMMPWHPTDRRTMHFAMQPAEPDDTAPEVLIDRAEALRGQLESPAK